MIHAGRLQFGPNTSFCDPASQALQSLEERLPSPEYQRRNKLKMRGCDDNSAAFSKKRCIRFDMTEMIAGIKPVEDSITFPVIEWAYDDDEVHGPTPNSDGNNGRTAWYSIWEGPGERETLLTVPTSKALDFRFGEQGIGFGNLVRSKSKTFHLVSLAPCTNTTQCLFPNCVATVETTMSILSVLPPEETPENERYPNGSPNAPTSAPRGGEWKQLNN